MKTVGIVIICVVVACVLLGLTVPSYSRISFAVEEVKNDAEFVLTDFNSFSLLYDVFQHSFNFDNSYDIKMNAELVKEEDGYYLDLVAYDIDEPDNYYTINSYFLTDVDDEEYAINLFNNTVRPSRLVITAHNDLVGMMHLPDIPLVELAVIIQLIRTLFFYIIGLILAVVFILVDAFGVIKALIICFLKVLGFIPIKSF